MNTRTFDEQIDEALAARDEAWAERDVFKQELEEARAVARDCRELLNDFSDNQRIDDWLSVMDASYPWLTFEEPK